MSEKMLGYDVYATENYVNEKLAGVGNVQPDWNQSDETAPDYIKNRTHGFGELKEIFPETTFNYENLKDLQYINDYPINFIEYASYTVIFDGVKYENLIAKFDSWWGSHHIGNLSLAADELEDNGLPFVMWTEYDSICLKASTLGEHTFQIFEASVNEISCAFLPIVSKKGSGISANVFNSVEKNIASGDFSHAEGYSTQALGHQSHAEGVNTTASGVTSHTEGYQATASGDYSHAEGANTTASGDHSHAEGYYTTASGDYQHVQGKYNIDDTEGRYAHIVGNGEFSYGGNLYSNAHTLDWQGNAWFSGDVYVGSTSGTNKDEGSKKLATEEYVNTELNQKSQVQFIIWEEED